MNPSLPRRTPQRRGDENGDLRRSRRRGATRQQSARTLAVLIAVLVGVATFLVALMAARAAVAQGQPPTASAPLPVSVLVRTLRDGGGLPKPGVREAPLNHRLTHALAKFLRENDGAAHSFDVLTGGKSRAVRQLTLEGELTGANTSAGASSDGGAYLCYLRLYQEGKPRRRLVGQWAGTADSLRYLTGNLGRDNRVSPLGLVGEMGGRIQAALVAVARDPQIVLETLARQTANRRPFKAVLDVAASAIEDKIAEDGLPVGRLYDVRVTSREAGEAYLIQMPDEPGAPPFLPQPSGDADAPAPPTWFAAGAFILPYKPVRTPATETLEVFVLFRRAPAPPTTPQPPTAPLSGAPLQAVPADRANGDEEPPVRVVGAVIPLPNAAQMKPALVALLARIAADAPGVWSAQKLSER